MFEGFSASAVRELVSSGHVGCVVTTHHNHHHLRPLLQDHHNLASLVLDSQDIKVETDLQTAEISPMFAIYEGGQSSLIAGDRTRISRYLHFIIKSQEQERWPGSIWLPAMSGPLDTV